MPVYEDGSALFHVPANTPIFVQPLDAEGKAQQQMRSWYTAMPGETASCIGCHERQNTTPPAKYTAAAERRPSQIAPWNGPARGFSFDREVQPVLDRNCAGCHNGQPYRDGQRSIAALDLRAKQLRPDFQGPYSPAYMELQRYVRRAGYESDFHLAAPAEFEADTSVLVQMLKKGHYGVKLGGDDWQRLYAWIDYNVPYPANWRESHRPPNDELVQRRAEHQRLLAGIDDHDEDPLPLPAVAPFEPPAAGPAASAARVVCDHWPLAAQEARVLQRAAGHPLETSLDLGDGATMKFSLIPAGRFVMGSAAGHAGSAAGFDDEQPQTVVSIERPFYLGQMEVTNRQYAQFDARHENGYIEGRGKDRTTRGTRSKPPINRWCAFPGTKPWPSASGSPANGLPLHVAHRGPMGMGLPGRHRCDVFFRRIPAGDEQPVQHRRREHCRLELRPLRAGLPRRIALQLGRRPLRRQRLGTVRHARQRGRVVPEHLPALSLSSDDGRDNPATPGPKSVRGGSWNDTMRYVTSASRWRYQPYQPVYNVGFRVLVWPKATTAVATVSRKVE